ncbi:hypothetical protein QTG54_015473 [Skeletonema marinoi]|uniref:Uncharacterized protein n=1 Tax=Skeletonema marinoi TaxID=267567 RepID=A0AAD9D4Q0_9STRA|nr:hypothetical protein QTG54_015473 [Skeletonema marinoi]
MRRGSNFSISNKKINPESPVRRSSSKVDMGTKTNKEKPPVRRSSSTTDNLQKRYPSTSHVEKYLQHYADALRLPTGFLKTIVKGYKSIDSRLWLMENSSSMKTRDGHRAKIDAQLKHIKREDGHSRWAELTQTVDFHVKMSARCFIPTKFWLVNDPGPSVGPQRFAVAWGSHDDVKTERTIALDMMNRVRLDTDQIPLARQLRKIEKRVREEAPRLMSANKVVTVILCTQGRQTDEYGNEGSAVMKDLVDSLEALSKLPVKIVVRLCADDEKAIELFNKIDDKFNSVDVLDDYWGEAMEVHLHNPWLTYGLGIQRLREAGLTSSLIGQLDEKAFNADDIYKFCQEFFIGEKEVDLPHPQNSLDAFMRGLDRLLKNEKLQWNPVKKKLTPWIDMKQLERQFRPRQQSIPQQQQYSGNGGQQNRRPDAPAKEVPTSSQDLTLVQIIQRWSHKAPDNKRLNTLQELLCTVPSVFPPTNTKVEPHDYFGKVPNFSEEAFSGNSGDDLNQLLKRAVRKMKFFTHPDKLPEDLTDNQTLLFKTIWDVIQEQEADTLQK